MPRLTTSIGTEELANEVEDVLRAGLNDKLAEVEAKWAPLDEQRAMNRGIPYLPVTLEPVALSAYTFGNIPSMVKSERGELTLDDFPWIAITIDDLVPDPEDSVQDQTRVFRNGLTVHSLAKMDLSHGVNIGAEYVVRRALRMSEAVHKVIEGAPSLTRKLRGLSNPQRSRPGEPFLFDPSGLDQDWFWVASFMQYVMKTYSRPEEV